MSSNFDLNCNCQRDRSYLIGSYACFSGFYALISIFILMIYLQLWKHRKTNHQFLTNFSSIVLISSLFIKSIGFSVLGIILRSHSFNFVLIDPLIKSISEAAILLAFSMILVEAFFGTSSNAAPGKSNAISKISQVIAGTSGIIMIMNAVLGTIYYVSQKSFFNGLNAWISFARDEAIPLAFIIFFIILKKKVNNFDKNAIEQKLNIISLTVLGLIMARGIANIVNYFVFVDNDINDSKQCSVSSLAFFIFKELICDITPVFCLSIMQDWLDQLLSYQSI